ncbi:MAG: hypothetical protein FWE70_01330 [Oscillospiraceae bacterium]|nr:hypothetical protein [Oscillospiraceae bacterium]
MPGPGDEDRKRLRELAWRCLEIAHLPETEEKARAWTLHNRCEGYRPMVALQLNSWDDIGLPLRCSDPLARLFEEQLMTNVVAHEVGDDTVTPPYVRVPVAISLLQFGTPKNLIRAAKGPGYSVVPLIRDITRDLDALPATRFWHDEAETGRRLEWIQEAIGDILPARLVNASNDYTFTPTYWIVDYMSMEGMYLAMIEEPEAFLRLMGMVERDLLAFLRWQEDSGLLFPNNGGEFIASGGYGFSDELPGAGVGGRVLSSHIWGHVNSQESIGISPRMYEELVYPSCARLAEQFGLLYYGCCEPINVFWDSVRRYRNLRKVSISPWCDEAAMGEILSGGKVIYSRKPSPHFVAWQDVFEKDDFIEYIKTTARLTKGCKVEYVLLDTCTEHNDVGKMRQVNEVVRRYGAYS